MNNFMKKLPQFPSSRKVVSEEQSDSIGTSATHADGVQQVMDNCKNNEWHHEQQPSTSTVMTTSPRGGPCVSVPASAAGTPVVQMNDQDRTLTIMHLRKLFTDLTRSQLATGEYEQRFYKMLPLFHKIAGLFTSQDLLAQFKEVVSFTNHMAKLLVQEVRKRAGNLSTEAAAVAVVQYLEPETSVEPGRGWQLLCCLRVLSATGSASVAEAMCQASVPSTLAKVLYLFYDLPPLSDPSSGKDAVAAHEKRSRFYETFVEVLTKLCGFGCAAEELTRKDDLSLLLSAVTSWCVQHNLCWRKATAEILMSLSSRSLTCNVLNYLHTKNCVELFLTNVKSEELSVSEKVEMIVCLFCLIKDSCCFTSNLLDDLKSIQGYQFLTDFILRHELEPKTDVQDALRNLLLMISSFTAAGPTELKPLPQINSLYQLPGFSMPQSSGQGSSVRNTNAFVVLQTVFMRSNSMSMCSTVLDIISSVYSADPVNYFVLDSLCTLGQFADIIFNKTKEIQTKYFELLEYVVFHLNFVPCRELIALAVLLKTQAHTETAVLCMHSLFKILSFNAIFKDVFREVGVLEVLVGLVQSYTNSVSDVSDEYKRPSVGVNENQNALPFLAIDMLSLLVKGNAQNAGIFRECGGTKWLPCLVRNEETRLGALHVVQQLLVNPNSDDDLIALLGMLHSAVQTDIRLKIHILKSLLFVLRESHRVRLAFRRVGGFLYVVSTLVTLEGSLSNPPKGVWENVQPLEVLELLQLVFKVVTIAMRFEPANAKFFALEVRYDSLTESLRLIGCFGERRGIIGLGGCTEELSTQVKEYGQRYNTIFGEKYENFSSACKESDLPMPLVTACCIIRLLYDMALDNFEKPNTATPSKSSTTGAAANTSISAVPSATDSIIVHPASVISILQILPAIQPPDNDSILAALGLQIFTVEVIKSLVRSERNQQVMCEAGLPRELFSIGMPVILPDVGHPLLPPLYYMIERLAAQAMHPKEIRDFLRIDMPLCCRDLCDESDAFVPGEGGPVKLSRVKTLVSMMTPRDYRIAGVTQTPPFVEFDMSVEGFGCIYLPSIAPQGVTSISATTLSAVSLLNTNTNDAGHIGGLGTGERIFPPLTGLTVLLWLYVDRFSDPVLDPHPIRLLTVIRTIGGTSSSSGAGNVSAASSPSPRGPSGSSQLTQASSVSLDQAHELSCLTIQISPVDKALIISTSESDTPGADLDRDTYSSDCYLRVPLPELKAEKHWCHLAISFNRAVLKNSTVSVFVNGVFSCTSKMHYIIQNPGGGATTLTQATSVNAVIGTPPGPLRKQSRLLWRLGTMHLVEEAMAAPLIATAFRLGPHYTGSFQSPVLVGEKLNALVAEERVIYGIHAQSVSQLTLAKLRKVYNKVDSRLIGKQLGISSHENATPIRLLHNSAGHLNGSARCIGGVLVGYLGMRSFCPRPVSRVLESVGGTSCLLGLVAMANESEGLYAAIKALLCAVRSNRNIANEMIRVRGYQTVAVLLKEKHSLLNSHILHLIFSLVGTLDSCRDATAIPNTQAFDDLLCNLELWRKTSPDLQRLLYEHFYELITESSDQQRQNLQTIRSLGVLSRLLQILRADAQTLETARDVVFNLIAAILQPPPDSISLLKFGQFVASTLENSESPIEKRLPADVKELQLLLTSKEFSEEEASQVRNVYMRNRCLSILLNMLSHVGGHTNYQICDLVLRSLGFDWLFELFAAGINDGTVALAIRILLCLLSHPTLLQKFKEGSGNGGWLNDTDSVVQNRAGVLLGFSVSAHGGSVGSACDINPEICHARGFVSLGYLLPFHAHLPDPYLVVLSLLVGQASRELPLKTPFNMDSIWSQVFRIPSNHSVADAISRIEVCTEAASVLVALAKSCLNAPNNSENWCRQYPQVLLQFLTFLYHNVPDFTTFCMSEEFLTLLIGSLFQSSESASPDANSGGQETDEGFEALVWAAEDGENGGGTANDTDKQTNVAARKAILDFLKSILVDSFPVTPATKGDSVVDIIIEMTPGFASKAEIAAYLTPLLSSAIDHILASDALLHGSAASLPAALTSGSNYSTLAANLFYFTSRLVDCVWNGLYVADELNVFQFILKLINQGKRKGGIPLDSLYVSLNRTILFLLSRCISNLKVQASVLDTLQKLAANRSVVFAPPNSEMEFHACLTHLLFMLVMSEPSEVESHNISKLNETELKICEGSRVVATAARRIWEELYISKKQGLEEFFKTPLLPEINAARSLIGDAANRAWQTYLDTELKGPQRDVTQIHAQLQSKIQKMAGGLTRLASRKSLRPTQAQKPTIISYQTLELWMKVHLSLIRELVRLQWLQYQQSHEHVEKYVLEEWHSVEQELTRERGLWGPNNSCLLDKWILDNTEGPFRVRKKLVRNEMFYILYPYRPSLDLPEYRPLRYKVAVSRDSRLFCERMQQRRAKTFDSRIMDTSKTVATPSDEKPFLLRDLKDFAPSMIRRFSVRYHSIDGTLITTEEDIADAATDVSPSSGVNSLQQPDDVVAAKVSKEESTSLCSGSFSTDEQARESVSDMPDELASADVAGGDQLAAGLGEGGRKEETVPSPSAAAASLQSSISKGPDNQTLLRLLEEGEELHSMFRCARVNGLETREGLLLFGKEYYYVVDGYTLLKTKEIRDLDYLPEELHDPIIPYMATGSPTKIKGLKRQCSKFAYEDIREVHRRRYLLQPIALEVFSTDGRNYLLAFPKKIRNKVHSKFITAAKNMISDSEQSISGQKSSANVEASGGLLSNFMGETSVTQRWVRGEISNFQYLMALNTLAGRSYNDLMQYPVFPWVLADYDSEELDLTDAGVYRDLSRPMGAQTSERLEQFMKRFREWDDPTGETPPYMYGTHYSSAMIVVSYLVRLEPFTQQFLKLQGGHFDLADRMFHSIRELWYSASKNNMADVKELIPEFFYLPEFLLNSNNFDLGAKQSGVVLNDVILPAWAKGDPREFIRIHREALESDYVSSHLHEWIDLIFGYRQQGPAAVEANNVFHHLFYEGNVDFEAIDDPLTRNATIGFINNFGQIPSQVFKKPHPAKKTRTMSDSSLSTRGVTTDRLFYHCLDNLKPPAQPIKELKGPVGQIVQNERGTIFAVEQNKVLLSPSFAKWFAWGFADYSIRLGNYDSDKSVCVAELSDCGQIVCAACPNSRTIITGGMSTWVTQFKVVSVWEIMAGVRGTQTSLRCRKTLYGHTEPVSCLAASGPYGIIVSGSQDCTCLVWDLSQLTFLRQLNAHSSPVAAVAINETTGDIASAAGTIVYLWTINGELLAHVNTATSPKVDSKQLLLSVAFSTLNEWDPQNVLLTGSNDGIVRMWSLEYIQTLESAGGDATPLPAVASGTNLDGVATNASTAVGDASTAEDGNAADHLNSLRDFNPETLRLKLMNSRENDSVRDDSSLLIGHSFAPSPDVSSPPSCAGPLFSGSDSGLGTPVLGRSTSRDDHEEASECSTPGGRMNKQGSQDSFVFVNKDGLAVVKTPNRLKPGFKWQRQLMFRSKLTMHTSFERKDNVAPSAITAIAPSRDHKTIFVGDARGRVWAWTVGDPGNGRADHWVQDPARQTCWNCQQRFSFSERRHHCRNCGQIFCAKCSRFESDIKQMKISKPVRVCQQCFLKLKETDG